MVDGTKNEILSKEKAMQMLEQSG